MHFKQLVSTGLLALLVGGSSQVAAQTWPTKPVRLVVGYSRMALTLGSR